MKPRILLIQPPIQDFYTTPLRLFPLGLLQIATALEKRGNEVKILDCLSDLTARVMPVPEKFSYIKKYYDPNNKSPFRLFGKYYHFGLEWNEIYSQIKEYNPSIVGIVSSFSAYYETALRCAEIAKEVNPDIITVMGGVHASAMPESLIKNHAVNFIIKGEAENVLSDFVLLIENNQMDKVAGLPGIVYLNENKIYQDSRYNVIENLDELNPNNLNLITGEKVLPLAMMQTSRGCPLNCSFCSTPSTPAGNFRMKSPEKVLEEILYYQNNFGILHIDLEDDNFTADIARSLKILDLVIDKTKVKLSAMNGLSSVFLNEDLLNKMKEAGFEKINLSVVSTDSVVKEKINRKESVSHLEKVIRCASSLNIEVETHFIIGIPGESLENTLDSFFYLAELPTKIGGSIFYPVPGTMLFDLCKDNGWIINSFDPSFWRLTLASTESYAGSRTDQITFLYLVRIVNFIKMIMKKYKSEKGRILFRDCISALSDANLTAQETLGVKLIKAFFDTGMVCKARKIKKEYLIEEEKNLNESLLRVFIEEINYIEF
jgi:radical SAM superfamily enzyme YgiQ (UPF0313 family)